MELLAESPRAVHKSSSFTQLNSSSFLKLHRKPNEGGSIFDDDEDRCHAMLNASTSSDKIIWENTEGYNMENIILYLIDMNILSAEQLRWKRFCEGVDFSGDTGEVKEQVFGAEEEEQPSTSAQFLRSPGNDASAALKEDNGASTSEGIQDDSSEAIVIALMDYFKKKQNGNTESYVPYVDVPENLLRIYQQLPEPPMEFFTIDGEQIRLRNPTGWRPPKRTFIFDLPKLQYDFTTLLGIQGHTCAGCGLKFQKRRPYLCNYFNELFCRLCFQGQAARIPARILHKWDFKEYPVSDIAFKFLHENEDQPVFDIHIIDQSLLRKVKNLRLIRSTRQKICHLYQYIKRCPQEVTTKYGILRTMFESIPPRFLSLELSYMYSVLDFVSIENGNLIEMLGPLEKYGTSHVIRCQICEERGFLCQVCINPSKIIFPFQLDQIFRCEACGSLSHLSCYKKQMGKNKVWVCSRCERIRKKRILQRCPFDSSNSD